MKPRVTIKDLAKIVGVSPMTVSAALSETKSTTRVSPETAKRIREVAESLNFRISLGARQLRQRELRHVGLIVETLSPSQGLIVKMTSIVALQTLLGERGWSLQILQDSTFAWNEHHCPDYIRTISHAGFVVYSKSPEADKRVLARLRGFQIPWVLIDGPPSHLNTVSLDHAGAAKLVTDHLLDLGHRRVLYYAFTTDHHSGGERLKGYEAAMRERALAPVVVTHLSNTLLMTQPEYRQHLLDALRDHRPTAIVCFNDILAWEVNQVLQENGWRVPHDLSLVGMNDLYGTNFCAPALTSASLGYNKIGQAAADAILERVLHPDRDVPNFMPVPNLARRHSTALPAAERQG